MQIAPNDTPMQHTAPQHDKPPEYGAPTQTMQETTPGYGAPHEQSIHQITSVTIQQPQQVEMQRYPRAPENVRDWTTGLCGCFSDIGGRECHFGYYL